MVKEYQWSLFQAGTRIVLVVSAEPINKALPVLTVLSLASLKTGRKIYPTEVLLSKNETGLNTDVIAMAHQIRTISKEQLGSACGRIESSELQLLIQDAMKLHLGIK